MPDTRTLSAHHVAQITDDVAASIDAELFLIYGDDAEPGDSEFDLLDDPDQSCPDHPGGHVYVTRCGTTECSCGKVVG